MTNQVLLDEFKELVESITLAVMQDIIKNQMSEEMIKKVIEGQTEESIKAFEEELPRQVDRIIETIQYEVSQNYLELMNKTQQVISQSIESFEKEIPKKVREQVAELIRSELNFNYLELSSKIEHFQKLILKEMSEKTGTTLSAVESVQEEQKIQQESLKEQEGKIEAVSKVVKDISTSMRSYETARKDDRKQHMERAQLQIESWNKKFKIMMCTQGITILLLMGSLVYMVMK